MVIDLHTHSSPLSACAVSDAETIVKTANERGLNGIVFTEHHRLHTESEMAALRRQFPGLGIFQAIEITTQEGEDLLVYGVGNCVVFQKRPPITTVIEQVRRESGAVVLAHPLRYADVIAEALYRNPPDACEAWSMNVYAYQRNSIRAFANETGCGLTAATDTHHADSIGVYAVRFHGTIATEMDLAAALREGAFTPLYDPLRLKTVDDELQQRAGIARRHIAAGLDTQTIRKEIGGSFSFIDQLRKGVSPFMMSPEEEAGDLSAGLQPIPGGGQKQGAGTRRAG
jgi:hypothetical protein